MQSRSSFPCSSVIRGKTQGRPILEHVCEKELKVEGTACFYDQTCLQPSDNLHRRIQVEAKACAVFVAILSPAYCQRYWCMLELDVATQNERTILPVFFDEVTGPGELPREEEFRNFFANDERVNKEILDRWWSNISQNLPAIYGIRMCSLARTRGRLVSLQDDVLGVIRGLERQTNRGY